MNAINSPAPDASEWDRAHAECVRTYAEYEAASDISGDMLPTDAGYEKAFSTTQAAFKVAMRGERNMLATPAPHITAVLQKLEIAVSRELQMDEIEPVLADLRRLGGSA